MNSLVDQVLSDFEAVRLEGLSSNVLESSGRPRTSLWKSYRRFRGRKYGLLYIEPREEDDAAGHDEITTEDIVCWLEQEQKNYSILQGMGANVPFMYDFLFEKVVRIGNSGAAGIIVEHLDEIGVYKLSPSISQIQRLRDKILTLNEDQRTTAQKDYETIANALIFQSPRDPQVLLTKSGRIYLIDVEILHQTGFEAPIL